jgi:putative transposase
MVRSLLENGRKPYGTSPDQIHVGQADNLYAARQATLDGEVLSTPERFVRQPPKPPQVPTAVWVNPPKNPEASQA